jgi:hypothetical protein
VKSQIAENAERFGNPALMIGAQRGRDAGRWTARRARTVFEDIGTPGSIPQFLVPPEMPGYVQNDIERIEQSIREISGQHEVTSGSVPTGVTAASAINLLQEQDDTRLGPDIGDMEQSIAQAGQADHLPDGEAVHRRAHDQDRRRGRGVGDRQLPRHDAFRAAGHSGAVGVGAAAVEGGEAGGDPVRC